MERLMNLYSPAVVSNWELGMDLYLKPLRLFVVVTCLKLYKELCNIERPDFDSEQESKNIFLVISFTRQPCTIAELLAKETNCKFIDADDFHPVSNKEKMCNGIPLSDEDRIPRLEMLQDALKESIENKKLFVKFVLLDADAEVLAARLEKRVAEGKHFMPATLLQSQLDLLQMDDCEAILKVDATLKSSSHR
ncbi:hypothetical protein FEM48_Zijuj11G0075400 [Ziziphus jujuba var. spinosa]|uniref:gluconokinase n=1 Tax=Ziziphus jujuba var. spinosa TaxID=714518 RepID=A0A978UHM9_ZIZJJ|nr:hypothetical protein FEM48_Zijuj11G0075400 [Ziziphus jujuba var. spinosa]